MNRKSWRYLLVLFAVVVLLLSSCAAPAGNAVEDGSTALTWNTWGRYGVYKGFLDLLEETEPDIELDFISYMGGNSTGYSWAQMRADDISDVFITSQILDEDLAKERLVDLSGYSFINGFSTAILDQVAIDGGVYLLPTNNSMYGIFYNKTLMEEKGWEVPSNFTELEALCKEIEAEGLIPGIIGTQLTGNTFSAVFNLAKTSWLTTPEGVAWEKEFLNGNATAAGMWEGTMDYVQRYIDIGMFYTDPEDRGNPELILDYLGERKAVFCTMTATVNITEFPDTGDKLGMMPYIGEDGSKNIYMYNPSSYIGISKRLTEPGNEEKLENAIKILSLLYSPEGQAAFISEETPCMMSVLDGDAVSEDSLIYDAQQALWEGRAFPMTYAHWENVLSDMGQAYKEWFRGENGMDGKQCIARMDELQKSSLDDSEALYFCESTEDFSLEETAKLAGKALGSTTGADAVMVPLGEFHEGGVELKAGISGKLYAGKINIEVSSTITPAFDGEYAVMAMTGSQAKELAEAGLDAAGDGNPFPYLLVTKEDRELEDDTVYQVAFFMQGYTEEVAAAYSAQVYEGSFRSLLRTYLEEQKTVSPDGNPWK
ncbi:MAG: carbohydrate ABC transporter substrate-binding protein [Lachnospiraceae bacterium]|nr:carbohydrate ABC transporter substrate-binding protein [Lachnospiraceae bacterium]